MHTARSLGIGLSIAALAAPAFGFGPGQNYTGVANANPKTPNVPAPNILTQELVQTIVAQGSMPLDGATTNFPYYGYDGDNANLVPAPGDVQAPGHNVEATKSEPDKNTYLVLCGQIGPDSNYDYGTHFLFQGHESGIKDASGNVMGSLTRINLDADGAHRVTLMATQDVNGNALPSWDGSTYDPWADRLLLTNEFGGTSTGGVYQATLDYPSQVVDLYGVFGHGGYEGIQNDSEGNVLLVEDIGGPKGTVNKHARQANSFVYRFIPANQGDLTQGGRLQALQVMSISNPGNPIVFHAGQADADILSQDALDLHTYGNSFQTNWVTIHDNAVDGFSAFDANALAKSHDCTPFKRPENGLYRPGTKFREFFFDETGDTDIGTEAGSAYGGFGSIMRLSQKRVSDSSGTLTLFFLCDASRSGLDNCAFWDEDHVVFVEDAGDTLHGQRNALDSAFLFDCDADYGNASTPAPIRILAEGRDPSATVDSAFGALGNGFQNDGDNEITGFHVSDGDASRGGILGAKKPRVGKDGWRAFWTEQHGDNVTWEILRADRKGQH
jgi:hypothetical protein